MAIDKKLMLFSAQPITGAQQLSSIINNPGVYEWGAGTPLYVEVWVDTPFTQDTSGEYLTIDLLTSSGGDPAADNVKIGEIVNSMNVSDSILLSTGQRVARWPLPSERIDDNVALNASPISTLAAGKITAFITI